MEDLCISKNPTRRHIDAAASLLPQPRLWMPGGDYPGHREWVEKALNEIELEKKRAIIAFSNEKKLGIIVYQRSAEEAKRAEKAYRYQTIRPRKTTCRFLTSPSRARGSH